MLKKILIFVLQSEPIQRIYLRTDIRDNRCCYQLIADC